MNIRIAAIALVAPLLAAALIAPRPLSIALGGPFTTVRSALAAYSVVVPPAAAAPVVQSAEPSFAGPGPGWG
jgi:hypothetical protein